MSKNANDYWTKRLANATWNTYNDTNKYHKELIKMYKSATQDIMLELFKIESIYAKNGVISRSEFYRANHLMRMEEGVKSILKDLGERVEARGSKEILNAGKELIGATGNILKDIGIELNYNPMLAKRMLQEPWKGATFSDRVWKNQDKLLNELNTTIKKGVMTGKSTSQMAMELSRTMDSKLYEASRLVRTETMHHLNTVNIASMKESGVKQVKEVVTLDERTSKDCESHEGLIWDIDKAPELPRHPNCRCVLVAYIDVDKVAEEFERREAKILFENGDIDEFEVAKRLGYNPLMQEEAIKTMEMEAKIWMDKLKPEELRSIKKYTGNGVDSDGTKLYEKINRYLWASYSPKEEEKRMLIKNISNIDDSFKLFSHNHDLITYRYQMPGYSMGGTFDGFLSTSLTDMPVMGNNPPNKILIVPKEIDKIYIDLISEYDQKELLLKNGSYLEEFAKRKKDDIILYIVKKGV